MAIRTVISDLTFGSRCHQHMPSSTAFKVSNSTPTSVSKAFDVHYNAFNALRANATLHDCIVYQTLIIQAFYRALQIIASLGAWM